MAKNNEYKKTHHLTKNKDAYLSEDIYTVNEID